MASGGSTLPPGAQQFCEECDMKTLGRKVCGECGCPRVQAGEEKNPLGETLPGAKAKAAAKAGEKKNGKAETKEPTEEEQIKLGPSGYKPNLWVEIFGLESSDGKKLNGQKGRITRYIYEKMRYEVSLGHKMVSVRPVSLKETEPPDAKWGYGNVCRLVCLQEAKEEELKDANGCLGTLSSFSRSKAGTWKVMANGQIHSAYPENIRVCTSAEESVAPGRVSQVVQSFAVVVVLHLLFGFGAIMVKLEWPQVSEDDGYEQADDVLRAFLHPTIPSAHVARLSAMIVVWSFIVLWGTLFTCCRMHSCLWDPSATCPQIAELSIGRKAARMLFRFGFGMVGALLFATVVLYYKLVQPHLPVLGSGAEDIFFWGAAAAVGMAVMTAICAEPSYTWQTLVHRLGGMLLAWAAFKHMNATRSLYLPGTPTAASMLFEMIKPYLPDRPYVDAYEEGGTSAELINNAKAFVTDSMFMRHQYVQVAVLIRYHILSYWPWTLFLPLALSGSGEKDNENSKQSASTLFRRLFASTQWLGALLCSVMYLTYAADLYVAATLPIPSAADAAEA